MHRHVREPHTKGTSKKRRRKPKALSWCRREGPEEQEAEGVETYARHGVQPDLIVLEVWYRHKLT